MWTDVRPFGRNALIIEWSPQICYDHLREISSLVQFLLLERQDLFLDIVPAYHSLTLIFRNEVIGHVEIVGLLEQYQSVFKSNKTNDKLPTTWSIPVTYGNENDKDMSALIKYTGLTRDHIIDIHTSGEYTVYFLGFLPGFLYLGGLDDKLCIPRKSVPDRFIPKGAVAIGGKQTGIYPQDSPGGWYVIGQTSFPLIDFYIAPYCAIKPGDLIKFEAVDLLV
ncbi:MAG: 5-oxoprolinase subunit PxpB [Saprospiraceae bacterium]|nr:5-oxoprolinase subunit PxpB [Saprospiraceae bacterium]